MKIVNSLLLLVGSFVILLVSVEFNVIHPNWLSVFLGYIFIVLTVFALQYFPEAIASKGWPSIEGEITTSEEGKAGRGNDISIYPKVKYSYTVNEEVFVSDRIKVGAQSISSTDRGWVERTLQKYPLGKKITVYCNPRFPIRAVLEPGFNLRIFSFMIIGLIFYAFAWLTGYIIVKSGGL